MEGIASHREVLLEILDYRGFIGGDSVSLCSGQLGGGALLLHGLYSVSKLFGISAAGCKFLFEKASLCFPNLLCVLVPDFPEKLHIVATIRCLCSTPQNVFVLVEGSHNLCEIEGI